MALQQHMVLQMLEDGPPSTTASYTSSRPSSSLPSSLPAPSLELPSAATSRAPTAPLPRLRFGLLALQSLGVVFGDIGTSPLVRRLRLAVNN